MTLPYFEKALDFVLLKEPVEIITCINHRKFKVVAVAISGPRAEQPFLFGLAVDKGLGKYRLTILSRHIGGSVPDEELKDEWIEVRKTLFRQWVKEWLANHPEQLFQAGVNLGITFGDIPREGEHWHNVYVEETVQQVVASLRRKKVCVEYRPNTDDPEYPNGYIEKNCGAISSCVRWRKTNKEHRQDGMSFRIPRKAMSCLQLLSTADNFDEVREVVARTFTVVQDCKHC